jgi:hypothetical protein
MCGAEIESVALAYQRVTGWAQPRRQGGTHALRLREASDVWACATCVEVWRGRPYRQEALA